MTRSDAGDSAPSNPPGLPAITVRSGTHATFLRRMLDRLHTQTVPPDDARATRRPLATLTTRDSDDPTIALLDAWATVADVLSFYQERIANEGYLRTATERRSLLELSRAAGYELSPGAAADALLQFTVDDAPGSPASAEVPAGTKVQSIPTQGQMPQVFETRDTFTAYAALNSFRPRTDVDKTQEWGSDGVDTVWVKGTANNLRAGDQLLLAAGDRRKLARIKKVMVDHAAGCTCIDLVMQRPSFGSKVSHEDLHLFVFRNRAGLFGSSAASTYAHFDDEKKEFDGYREWELKAADQKPGIVTLDAEYAQVIPGGWIAITRPDQDPVIHRVQRADPITRSDYGMTSRVTQLTLALNSDSELDRDSDSAVALPIQPMADHAKEHPALWGYTGEDGPENWAGLADDFAGCGSGMEQSPIDIPADAPLNAANLPFDYRKSAVNILNNGHTVQVNCDEGSRVKIDGETYDLMQFHFHSPSEHTLDGSNSAMEMHLVHVNDAGDLAFIAVMIEEGSENADYAPVFDNMPAEEGDLQTIDGLSVNVANLLPDSRSYYRYDGSLATPPCTEGVKWHVLSQPVELSSAQIAAFTAIFEGNNRPVQPLNERTFITAGGMGEGDGAKTLSDLRVITVLVQSEVLELSPTVPFAATDLAEGELELSPTVLLAATDLAVGLDPNFKGAPFSGPIPILVAGETSTGKKNEVVEASIRKDDDGESDQFILRFEQDLKHVYQRDTITFYGNLVHASHGQTVSNEVLGSGDASKPNQRFVLRHTPLTYTAAATASGGSSTLSIRVSGLLWREVPSLLNQDPTSRSYTVQRDNNSRTVVIFGDGLSGARLPSGSENVTATYRYGLGPDGNVPAEALSLLQTRPYGIRGVRNPNASSGGTAPATLQQARTLAPLANRSMGRLVSPADYAHFARTFAGIGKAQARLLRKDGMPVVQIIIATEGGGQVESSSALYKSLLAALRSHGSGLQRIELAQYLRRKFNLEARVLTDPRYRRELVLAAIQTELIANYSFAQRAFGQALSSSELITAVQSVPGVLAVDLDQPQDGVLMVESEGLLLIDADNIKLQEWS